MLVDNQTLIGQITPTVYIDKITLEGTTTGLAAREDLDVSSETGALRVTLNLVVKDKLNAKFKSTWFRNKDLTKFIKIKVIQTTNKEIHNLLSARNNNNAVRLATNPGSFFQNINAQGFLSQLENYLEHTEIKSMSLTEPEFGSSGFLNQHTETDISGNTITNFNYRLSFDLDNPNPAILSYFCFSYIDPDAFQDSFEISLPSNFPSLNGKVSSDIVFETKDPEIGPELVSLASAFYDNRNIIWPGPVHQLPGPDGKWRKGFEPVEGESADVTASKDLFKKLVPNTKIQDFRIFHRIIPEPVDLSMLEPIAFKYGKTPKILRNDDTDVYKKQSYFSNAWLSQDENNNIHFIFGVNKHSLIKYKAKFGKLLDNPNLSIVNEIIQECKIKSFKIIRRRIKNIPNINTLGSFENPEERFEDTLKSDDLIVISGEKNGKIFEDTENGYVREIEPLAPMNDTNSSYCKYFSISDRQLKNIHHGQYQYGVEMFVEDGTVIFLKNKLKNLLEGKRQLEQYFQDAVLEYNSIAQKYSEKFPAIQRQKYINKIPPWNRSLAIYLEALQILTTTVLNSDQELSLLGILNPATGNLEGLRGFILAYDKMISTMQNLLGKSPSLRSSQGMLASSNEAEKPSYVRGTAKYPSFLECQNWFTNISINVDNLNNNGISYFGGISGPSFREMSVEEFQNRRDVEQEKYSISNREVNLSFMGPLSEGQRSAQIQSYNSAGKGFSYLSPLYINIGGAKQNTSTITQNNSVYQEIENSILNINLGESISNLGVRIAKIYERDPIAIIYQETSTEENGFSINASPTIKRYIDPIVESTEIVAEELSSDIRLLEHTLSRASANNFGIPTSIGTSGFAVPQIPNPEAPPAAVTSLILDDDWREGASSRRSNYSNDIDVSSTYEINWSLIHKIEVFTGFKVNDKGHKMVKAEKWETLTNELYIDNRFRRRTLLCRMVPYSNQIYGIRYNNNLELPIYNKYFLLEGLPAPVSRYEMEHLGEVYAPSDIIPRPIVTEQEATRRYRDEHKEDWREGASSRRRSYQAQKEDELTRVDTFFNSMFSGGFITTNTGRG
tara:strand:- start:1522 stop:4728 length:3207 start_codon:yes stop_codon:yes gene_type:complete